MIARQISTYNQQRGRISSDGGVLLLAELEEKKGITLWAAIHTQFGAGFDKLFHFKPRFGEALSGV